MVVDVKITSTDKMNESFKEKDKKYREWATKETRESKVVMAVMVPLIISHDGAIHKDTIRRWKSFAPDIKVDWVRMAQNILRYNVFIVGKFFNKGSWVSEAWRKEHPEVDEVDEPPERMVTADERMKSSNLEPIHEGVVCARSLGTPPPHGVRLMPAEGETQIVNERTNQPI